MAADSFTYYRPVSDSLPDIYAAETHGFVLEDGFTMSRAMEMATFLVRVRAGLLPWRLILNNATSTRPKSCGGATCPPLTGLLDYRRVRDVLATPSILFPPGSARAADALRDLEALPEDWWCSILTLPNSFSLGDGLALRVAAAGGPKQAEAMQKVSLLALAHLLLRGPTLLLLRSNHWVGDVRAIQQRAAAISAVEPPASGSGPCVAPAPPPRSARALAYYEPPAAGEEQERDTLICSTLTEMIVKSKTGWVAPSNTKGWRILRQYVLPGGLAKFIREHEQFQMYNATPQAQTSFWMFGLATSKLPAPASGSEGGGQFGGASSGGAASSSGAARPAEPSANPSDDVSDRDLAAFRAFLAIPRERPPFRHGEEEVYSDLEALETMD